MNPKEYEELNQGFCDGLWRICTSKRQYDDIQSLVKQFAEPLIRRGCNEEWIKWGEETCPHPTLSYYFANKAIKRTCRECWQARKKEKGIV